MLGFRKEMIFSDAQLRQAGKEHLMLMFTSQGMDELLPVSGGG